jgi:hypothetical protein
MINVSLAAGGITDYGLGGGLVTSKQHKREKSVFDAINCHVYLTNIRLVFVKASFNLSVTEEKKLEGIFSDIDLSTIEGIVPGTKFNIHSTIDLSVRSPNGEINKISVAFLDTGGKIKRSMFSRYVRAPERDAFLESIQLNIKKKTEGTESNVKSEFSNDEPLKILKIRFAKGEISREEYEEMSKLME